MAIPRFMRDLTSRLGNGEGAFPCNEQCRSSPPSVNSRNDSSTPLPPSATTSPPDVRQTHTQADVGPANRGVRKCSDLIGSFGIDYDPVHLPALAQPLANQSLHVLTRHTAGRGLASRQRMRRSG